MPGPKIHPRLVRTGGKIRKGFSTDKQGPKEWPGTTNFGVRDPGITELYLVKDRLPLLGKYIPLRNRIPVMLVPDLKDCELKPYLSPRCKEAESYPTSHHDVIAVMQAEGYSAATNAPVIPAPPHGGKVGFPEKKKIDQVVDDGLMAIPKSLQERLVRFSQMTYQPDPKTPNPAKVRRKTGNIFWVPKEFWGPEGRP